MFSLKCGGTKQEIQLPVPNFIFSLVFIGGKSSKWLYLKINRLSRDKTWNILSFSNSLTVMACTLEDYVNSKTAECYIIFSKWLNRKKMEWPWSDFITEAVGVIALLAWWHYSPTNSCSPAELHPHLSRPSQVWPQSTWNFSIMFWEPKKNIILSDRWAQKCYRSHVWKGLKGGRNRERRSDK